ncbi:IS66 C-terminal element, partial [Pseudorhodobacter antarcticus]
RCILSSSSESPRLSCRENSTSAAPYFRGGLPLTTNRARLPAKAPLGEALKYIAKYWDGLCLFLTDGRIEMDSNAVERTSRPIALNRKNALFAGHDAGATNWGIIASLIETCKLNSVDPHAYLADTFTAMVAGHKQSQINDLLPWNYVK